MIRNIYITFFAIQALLMLALAVAGGASSLLLGLLVTAIVFQIKMPEKYKLILGLYLAYNTLLIALFYLFYMFWRKWFLFMLPAVPQYYAQRTSCADCLRLADDLFATL